MAIASLAQLLAALSALLTAVATVGGLWHRRPVDNPEHVAYCPQCNAQLGGYVGYGESQAHARVHASVTGHPTHVVRADTWTVVETASGEPSLPLWD